MESLYFSMGILACNEEAIIGRLPAPVRLHSLHKVEGAAIFVVAKGCSAIIIGTAIPIPSFNRQPIEPT